MIQNLPLHVRALCNEGIYPRFNSGNEISYLIARFLLQLNFAGASILRTLLTQNHRSRRKL